MLVCVERSSSACCPPAAAERRRPARVGPTPRGRWDEWHVDLEKTVTLDKLGRCPACPDSRKKPDLRAIRRWDRCAPMPTPGTVEFWSRLAHHGRHVETVRSASTEDMAGGASKPVGEGVVVAPELHELENARWPIAPAPNAP